MNASKHVVAAVLCCAISLHTYSSFARQGTPPVSRQVNVKALREVHELTARPIDVRAELNEDKKAKGSGPLRIASSDSVQITPRTHGIWENVPGGRLWRLRVVSQGATDLNFGFTQCWLPEGATLHIASESEDYFQGPYTASDNKAHRELWTPLIPGHRAVIELFVPAGTVDEPQLLLSQINRGYRDMFHRKVDESAEKAGTCNIDVICSQGDAWRNEIRSVARYTINGIFLCTGTLINNAAVDDRNFFLTAAHCDVTAGNAGSVVVYWNYQSPSCGLHSGGSLAQNQNGTTFRMSKADVDVALLELDDVPESTFNVYYAGWDRSGTAVASVVGIHHPNGDEKSITFCNNALNTVSSCIGGGGGLTHWQAVWSSGTTEPGSSGSGIWNVANRRIVGTLSGGGASCDEPLEPDCYGKISVAWDSGLNAATRLRDWLDPNNTGISGVDGRNPRTFSDYDLARDFSTNSNPNGQWSYGWQSTVGGAFNLLTSAITGVNDNGVNFRQWIHGNGAPVFQFFPFTNTTIGISDGGQGQYPPGTVLYYAGLDNTPQNLATIRFTAPSTGNYLVGVQCHSYLNGSLSSDADFHVVRNNVELYGLNVPANAGTTFTGIVALAQGGIIDFVAGRGADNRQSGSGFKIAATITPTNAAPPTAPQIVAVSAILTSEGYTPTNRAADPGENVSVTYSLRNIGTANADVIATLLATNGVLAPGPSQTYSLNTNGIPGSKTFSFNAAGLCGVTITNVLQLQIGGTNFGQLAFTFPLGAQLIRLNQSFDTVKPPALPNNWQAIAAGSAGWITTNVVFNTPTNSIFVADPIGISDALLTSPSFPVASTNAQLSFSHRYETEYGFDGCVLEISINNEPFQDILAAGGRFGANGYNYFIDNSFGNPLGGRDAWTGDSTNFVTTTVMLPASAVGKTVRLRWRLASDSNVAAAGWYVDSVLVTERGCNYPATLPRIVNTHRNGSNVVFSFNTRAGIYYAVEYKDSFADAGWTPLTIQNGDGAMRSITNNISAGQRFYRLRPL